MSILNKIFSWNKQPRTPYYGFSYGGAMPPERKTEDFLHAYGQIGWLFAVVSKIGVGCSGVKWRLFKGDERSERSGIGKHPVLTTLDSFNPYQTGAEGIELTQIYLDLIGECFWVLNYNALGEPAEIWIPYPSKMSIVPDKQKFIKGYVYGAGQEAVPFELNEIIHFKYPNPLNQYRGMSPAQALAVDLDAEQYSGEWNRNFFYNSARPDGVIEFDYKLSDEQYDRLKKQWSEKYKGVNKAHQVGLLEGGGKYKQIQVSQKDMDFRALRLMNRDNILGVYGMPLSVMGITENVNKANAEAGDYTFARWLVKPRLDRMKNKLNEQFIPLFRKPENLELDYDEVVPETLEQKMQLAESGIRAGYLTINEARKLRGLDPLKPDMGDVLLVPLNLIPTPISGKPIPAPAPAPARAGEKPEEEPVEESYKGGEGSGNFGHEGRPGEVGGSGGGGGGVATHANRINNIGYISDESEARDFRDSLDADAENDPDLQNLLTGSDRWVAGQDWEGMKKESDNYFKTGEAPDDTKALMKAASMGSDAPTLYRGISVDGDVDSVIASYENKEFDLSLSSFTSQEAIADSYANIWGKETKVTFQMSENGKAFYVAPTQPDYLENQEWITGGRFKVNSVSREGKNSVRVEVEQIATFNIKRLDISIFKDLPSSLKLHWGGLLPKGMKR